MGACSPSLELELDNPVAQEPPKEEQLGNRTLAPQHSCLQAQEEDPDRMGPVPPPQADLSSGPPKRKHDLVNPEDPNVKQYVFSLLADPDFLTLSGELGQLYKRSRRENGSTVADVRT